MPIFLSLYLFLICETASFEPWDFVQAKHPDTKPTGYQSTLTIVGLWGIKFYQRFISPQYFHRCQFKPSCSQYGYLAVKRVGVLKGLIMAAERILRCHPYAFLENYPLIEDKESDPLGVFELLNPIEEGKKFHDPIQDNIIHF